MTDQPTALDLKLAHNAGRKAFWSGKDTHTSSGHPVYDRTAHPSVIRAWLAGWDRARKASQT